MSNPRGVHCPACRGPRISITHRKKPCGGVNVRYCRCDDCSCRFSTEERVKRVTRLPRQKQGAIPPATS